MGLRDRCHLWACFGRPCRHALGPLGRCGSCRTVHNRRLLVTASTSFANPAVAIARSLSDTFSGIRRTILPAFIAAELAGAFIASIAVGWLLVPARGSQILAEMKVIGMPLSALVTLTENRLVPAAKVGTPSTRSERVPGLLM